MAEAQQVSRLKQQMADVASTIRFYRRHREEFPHGAQSTWRLVEDVLRRGPAGRVSSTYPSTDIPDLQQWLIDVERVFLRFPANRVDVVYDFLYRGLTVPEIAMNRRCSGYAVNQLLERTVTAIWRAIHLSEIGFVYHDRGRRAA